MLENSTEKDKKLNRKVVIITIVVIVIFTVVRLIPFLTADARKKASQLIGVALPEAASEIQFADKSDFHGGDFFVAAKMPRTGFLEVMTKLDMTNRTDLLSVWPNAFDSSVPWWQPTHTNDTNTFYANRPNEWSKVFARYENGEMYFKRTVPKR